MKNFLLILALAVLFIAGCNHCEDGVDATVSPPDSHREAIAKFQDGQKSFKELIATVRDEKSFDAAKPGLDKVVSDWREVATTLAELTPPSKELQLELRELIAEGHRATEPMGEDMLSLISIESRETEVNQWLEKFVEVGGEAAVEMNRLYGEAAYCVPEAKAPKLDLSSATINGVPLNQAMNDPVTILQNDDAGQVSAGQSAARPEPNAEGRSR